MARPDVDLVTSGHFRCEAVTAYPAPSLTGVTRRWGAVEVSTVVGEEAQR